MANKIATKSINVEDMNVMFKFVDGTTRTIALSDLSEGMVTHLALHGLSQKGGDSYSGAESVGEAVEKFNSTIDMLLNGDWSAGRSASGGIWVDAIAAAADVSREEALAKWNAADDDTRKELKKHPAIKAAKAQIELERAKTKVASAGEAGGFDLSEI
jgi:hypothetical protein